MQGILSLGQCAVFRPSLACVAALVLVAFTQAQSLNDVHVEPRQKPSTEPHAVDAASIRGLPGLGRPFHVDVDLVLVPVTVTDALNRPVTTLQKEDFALFERGKRQEIRYFDEEDAPISVAVLLDISKSMSNKIETERAALKDFFNNANPKDEYFAITFSDRPRLVASGATSIEELEQELTAIEPGGSTAMLDAIYMAEAELRAAKYKRRAIVIFSDGGDNVSHYSHREVRDLVREGNVEVYAIGLFETFFFGTVGTIEEKLGKMWLSEITDCTGGRTVAVESREKVPEAAAAVSREMRSQYVLGYRPAIRRDGQWRKIKVSVESSTAGQPLHASYKNGYISLGK